MLLAEGRLPECWIPPGNILECSALLETYHDLRREHTAWAQRIHAVLFHQGAPAPDHRYYAQVKDRQGGKRAALSEARKLLRQACHILAGLGDDALTTA